MRIDNEVNEIRLEFCSIATLCVNLSFDCLVTKCLGPGFRIKFFACEQWTFVKHTRP